MSTAKKTPAKSTEELQSELQSMITRGRKDGMIRATDLSAALEKQFGFKVDKRKISMDDIKAFGSYTAELKLPQGVVAKVTVKVVE